MRIWAAESYLQPQGGIIFFAFLTSLPCFVRVELQIPTHDESRTLYMASVAWTVEVHTSRR